MNIPVFGAVPLFVLVLFGMWLISSIKILNEYERAVVFRLGRLLPETKGPGLVVVLAPVYRMVRMSLRTVVHDIPPQDVITRDNVSVKVSAVVYYRVIDPRRAVNEVEQYHYATSQLAQTTLRSVLGQVELDSLLSQREKRAKVIHAEGEFQAAAQLVRAADAISANPTTLQLRYLQTLTEIATEKNSTIIFPLPIDLLQAFVRREPGPRGGA